jgi:hypothetical protein
MMFRADTGAGRHIIFNPSTGVITSTSGTLVTSGSQAFGNGWWRYWFTYVADTTTVRGNIRPDSAGLAQTFIVWGAQTEEGEFPTSYIPTTTAEVTRAADVASINTLSPWFNATEGSFFVQASNLLASAPALFSTDDGTTNNRIINYFSNPTTPSFRVISGGVDQANISSGVISLQSTFKLASAYKVNDFAASLNGAAAVVDTSGTIPSGQTTARLGSNVVTAGLINGYLQRITYYPRRLTNAELQTLTA